MGAGVGAGLAAVVVVVVVVVVSSVQPSDLVFNPGSFYGCNHQTPRLFAVWSLLRTGSINDYVTVTSFSK